MTLKLRRSVQPADRNGYHGQRGDYLEMIGYYGRRFEHVDEEGKGSVGQADRSVLKDLVEVDSYSVDEVERKHSFQAVDDKAVEVRPIHPDPDRKGRRNVANRDGRM